MFKELNSSIVLKATNSLLKDGIKVKTSHMYQIFANLLGYKSYQVAKSKNACFLYCIIELKSVYNLDSHSLFKIRSRNVFKELFFKFGYTISHGIIDNFIKNTVSEFVKNFEKSNIYLGKDEKGYQSFTNLDSALILGDDDFRTNIVVNSILQNFLVFSPKSTNFFYWSSKFKNHNFFIKKESQYFGPDGFKIIFDKIKDKEDFVKKRREDQFLMDYSSFVQNIPNDDVFIIDDFDDFLILMKENNKKFPEYLGQKKIFLVGIDSLISKDSLLFAKQIGFKINSSLLLSTSKNLSGLKELNLDHSVNNVSEQIVMAKNNGEYAYFYPPLFTKEEVIEFTNQVHNIRKK